MQKKYIGKNRAENIAWLMNVWLKNGPPVCFLQGFSGVGKTDLARDFRELAEQRGGARRAVINEIADRSTPSVLESLMELSITLSQQGLPEMEQVLFERASPNLGFAIEKALRRPVVIILDEVQRFFRDDSSAPLPELNGILSFLRNRPTLPGRLLLLSDRIVEEARWSEWIPKRTLTKLEPEEAVIALDAKLTEACLNVEIPIERKKEVVRDLDFNPRAIEALVGALRYDSLDEIIESNPGLWVVRDREVSHEFLKALERDLLERTMRHLDNAHQQKLRQLAVHRRNFRREALEMLCVSKDEANELRSFLVTRYLLNFYRGSLALNPIVREISHAHLRDAPDEFKQAHSKAANYHLRHFKAKQIVDSQTKLGESFAELRYHLVQAGRESEIEVIGQRFTEHLEQEISFLSPIPVNREELDERIGVLTAVLGNAGIKKLEYHLARCLQSRGNPGDLKQAAFHASRATGSDTPASSWYLRAKLENQVVGLEAAIRTIYEAVHKVPATDTLFSLFQLGAELLADAGRADKAIALLREGINVPDIGNLFSLYHSCAELLAGTGKTEEAIALLREGIKVPDMTGRAPLYHSCAELLAGTGKTEEAIALLREGIKAPDITDRAPLYHSCAELLAGTGKTKEAIALLREGINAPDIANLFSLYHSCAELLAGIGKTNEAIQLLKEGTMVVFPQKIPHADAGLLKQIEQIQNFTTKKNVISSAETSLQHGVNDKPQIYVSYAWGEDSSETGREREEIVDRLCDAVVKSGRLIGRDKNRMRCGDSIERFANEISKADRIVAVISKKFLHSKYCMVLELYAAWRRCNHKAEEFQKKVVALVMDDARASLDDDLQIAMFWKGQYEKEKADLLAVDPDRHSIMRWAYINQLGEMYPKVPDMLGAVKDIVMKRGFEAIVIDDFNEVLLLLPPRLKDR